MSASPLESLRCLKEVIATSVTLRCQKEVIATSVKHSVCFLS